MLTLGSGMLRGRLQIAFAAFFVLFAFATPVKAANVGDTVDAFSAYYGVVRNYLDKSDEAYNAFRDQSVAVKAPFYMIAFLILAVGLVGRFHASRGSGTDKTENILGSITKVFVIVGLAASSVQLVELVRDGGQAVGQLVSGGGGGSSSDQWKVMFKELAALTRTIQAEPGWGNIMGALWLGIKVVVIVIDALLIVLADAVILIGQLIAACVLGGSIMLMPVFIAILIIPTLASRGVSFLSSIVGVALWPFGWALAGFILIAPLRAITQGELAQSLTEAMSSTGQGDLAEVAKLLVFAVFPLIVFVLNFGTPMLVSRLVSSGGNAISGAMGKAALAPVQAATAGAGLAAGAAVMAATGGAGGGMAAAGALASAMKSGGGGSAAALAGATDSSRSAGRDAAT